MTAKDKLIRIEESQRGETMNSLYYVTMERRFFAKNHAGDNEFEYLLHCLGVPKERHGDIDEVRFGVDLETVDYRQDDEDANVVEDSRGDLDNTERYS